METFVAAFDAAGLVLGDATRRHPGVSASYTCRPGPDGPVVLDVSLRSPWYRVAPIVRRLRGRYRAKVRRVRWRPGQWTAQVTYTDLSSVEDHPMCGPLLQWRGLAQGVELRYANGMCIVRVEHDQDDASKLLEALRSGLRESGLAATARLVPADFDPFGDD